MVARGKERLGQKSTEFGSVGRRITIQRTKLLVSVSD